MVKFLQPLCRSALLLARGSSSSSSVNGLRRPTSDSCWISSFAARPTAARKTTRRTMSSASSSSSSSSSSSPQKSSKDGPPPHAGAPQPQQPEQPAVKESLIRKMTRLAHEFHAVNLSQGFPNEGPPWALRLALAHAVLTGREFPVADGAPDADDYGDAEHIQASLVELLTETKERNHDDENGMAPPPQLLDQLNQYSPPMGRADLRRGIADYYARLYNYRTVSPDDHVTVTLGATEAVASALRTVGRPGDKCVILEPFHELYPSQCRIFYLEPVYVTLRVVRRASGSDEKEWHLDWDELERALRGARVFILNSPHNPTGKVFTRDELSRIVQLCLRHDVYIITDEIYEHMIYNGTPHCILAQEFPEIADRCLMCNSIGKSASATGWRLGWCLHPAHLRDAYRGIHDQLAVMSPHPVQYAVLTAYLHGLPDGYFARRVPDRYRRRVSKLARALADVGFQVVAPQGAYYLFVDYTAVPALRHRDCTDACLHLLREVGVACVPGDNFYGSDAEEAGRYLRFAACRSDADLDEAIRRLQKLRVPQS